jgi:hypothetical protein
VLLNYVSVLLTLALDIRTPIVDPNDLDTYPISSLSHRAVLQLQRP